MSLVVQGLSKPQMDTAVLLDWYLDMDFRLSSLNSRSLPLLLEPLYLR